MNVDAEKILSVEQVNRSFVNKKNGESKLVLKDIDFSVKRGEFVSIIGASGCGKTTLLRLIAGLDSDYEGNIFLDGKRVHSTSPECGFVFQQGCLFEWLTIEENVAMGLKARKIYTGNADKVQQFIDKIGLSGFEKVFPHQISGGMAQRVAIARALINNPKLLLLDEPMGALDTFTRAEIQDLLLDLKQKHNTTMLLVTHDIDEAIYLSNRVIIMTPRPGRISEILSIDDPFPRDRGDERFLKWRKKILERFDLARAKPTPEYFI